MVGLAVIMLAATAPLLQVKKVIVGEILLVMLIFVIEQMDAIMNNEIINTVR